MRDGIDGSEREGGGGLSLEDFSLRDIDEAFREIEEMMERELQSITRERKLPDGSQIREWEPFVYGYSITIGPDGKPQIRGFANLKPEAKLGISIKEEREPLVDVMTANGEVKVIAELSGVEKKDIKLRGTEKTLTISVDTPQRKYYK